MQAGLAATPETSSVIKYTSGNELPMSNMVLENKPFSETFRET
jgi:hypothetical protein